MARTLKMSAVMVEALEFAVRGDGALTRWQGGFWTIKGMASNGGVPNEYVGTTTVEALVARGRMIYTAHQEGRSGKFPVAAEVVSQ